MDSSSSSPTVSLNSGGSASGMKNSQSSANSFNLVAPIKLDRTNYLLWRSTVLPIIRGNRLEGYITGKTPCPEEEIITDAGKTPNPKFDDWVVTDQLLLGWLYNSINLDIAAQFIDCKSSQELWKGIEDMAGAQTRAKQLWYKNELHRTRKGSLKMEEYLQKMKTLADNLQRSGSPISLSDLISQVLCGLDTEYTPIVTQLLYMPNVSWIEFSTALLTFESRVEQLNAV